MGLHCYMLQVKILLRSAYFLFFVMPLESNLCYKQICEHLQELQMVV